MLLKYLKQFSRIYSFILFVVCFLNNTIFSEGFISGTLIKYNDTFIPIELLRENSYITTYNFKDKKVLESKIIKITRNRYNKCYKLKINGEEIIAASDQKIFVPFRKGCWLKVQDIKKDDFVIRDIKDLVRVEEIIELNQESDFYCLSLDKNHNYFISKQHVFVHNEVISLVLGSIGGFEIVVNFSIWAIGALGIWAGQKICGTNKISNKTITTLMGAKSPGKPTAEDGFVPPKNWDGNKKRHEGSGEYGYPDKKGNIWIPTGDNGHGGPHWDVQKPGGGYDNVMPGGKIRPGRK